MVSSFKNNNNNNNNNSNCYYHYYYYWCIVKLDLRKKLSNIFSWCTPQT